MAKAWILIWFTIGLLCCEKSSDFVRGKVDGLFKVSTYVLVHVKDTIGAVFGANQTH